MERKVSKVRKRVWTLDEANAYIGWVSRDRAPRGLKACSAIDYLENNHGYVFPGWPERK